MLREILTPKTKDEWLNLRIDDVTSTEIAALFGISPYITLFELWWRKKNKLINGFEENIRMTWGTRLQDSIAKGVAEDNGFTIRKMNEYIRLNDFKAGSSFDFCITDDPLGILEIKNVDGLAFKEGWLVDGDNIEAPPHIEIQVQYQMWVSGMSHAVIAALVGGNRVVLIKREADKEIHAKFENTVSDFWKSIESNREPEPDFKRDSEFIAKLYKKANAGEEIYAGDELIEHAKEYQRWKEVSKKAEQNANEYKAKILMEVGTASKVLSDDFTISLGETKGSTYTVERKPGRSFRIYFKGEEENGK